MSLPQNFPGGSRLREWVGAPPPARAPARPPGAPLPRASPAEPAQPRGPPAQLPTRLSALAAEFVPTAQTTPAFGPTTQTTPEFVATAQALSVVTARRSASAPIDRRCNVTDQPHRSNADNGPVAFSSALRTARPASTDVCAGKGEPYPLRVASYQLIKDWTPPYWYETVVVGGYPCTTCGVRPAQVHWILAASHSVVPSSHFVCLDCVWDPRGIPGVQKWMQTA